MIFYTAYGVVPLPPLGWRCAALIVVASAQAVTVTDLYETAQPVDGSRDAAFVEALKTVLVRVSGQRDAAQRVGEVSDPRKYVQRFGFTADNVLEVGFDSVVGRPAAVERRLADLGPRASGDRRDVRRGGSRRLLALAQRPTRRRRSARQSPESRASAVCR